MFILDRSIEASVPDIEAKCQTHNEIRKFARQLFAEHRFSLAEIYYTLDTIATEAVKDAIVPPKED